jgi:hypothetical protein
MGSPRNALLSGQQALELALELLDRRKQRLCAIVESVQTTSDEKYQALVKLACLTGALVDRTQEARMAVHNELCPRTDLGGPVRSDFL